MRLRILKDIITVHGAFDAGDVVIIPDDMAKDWLAAGLAMEEKSLSGGKETKRGGK
jgi:hypothetical protein